jgi:flagellum-specific peptidoglycan hydrolase FlgJ
MFERQGRELVNPEFGSIFKFMLLAIRTPSILKRFIGLAICILPWALGAQNSSHRYVLKYRPLADSLSRSYGVPASVILGVSLLESGSGTSRNCRLLNNYFGIVGKNNLLRTQGIRTRYKQYATDTASFIDFCRLMTRKRFYPSLKNNPSSLLWVQAISKAGYSEVPATWQKRVLSTIRQHHL